MRGVHRTGWGFPAAGSSAAHDSSRGRRLPEGSRLRFLTEIDHHIVLEPFFLLLFVVFLTVPQLLLLWSTPWMPEADWRSSGGPLWQRLKRRDEEEWREWQ